jgi:choline dehydrogenase-like flavoprotein
MSGGTGSYDVVAIGSGFATSFFLWAHLRRAGRQALRVLVLERGPMFPHAKQRSLRRNSPVDEDTTFHHKAAEPNTWRFNIGFGGGSNCWTGNVPRLMPADFRMASTYGVGRDWPVSYEELEPYYETAEEIMSVAGPERHHPYPKRGPYPQPPHRLSLPDRMLQRASPDAIFAMPTARARVATPTRGACCASGVCSICPVDAKFTILNGMADLYGDRRVTLLCEAEALAIETASGRASGVRYRHGGREHVARADMVLLGANAIFNPALMLRSGLDHPMLGRHLHEHRGFFARILLDGLDNFQGSTFKTAFNYALYDGPHRRDRGACLIDHSNVSRLRPEFGRWRQILELGFTVEDLPDARNRVTVVPADPKPTVTFAPYTDYYRRGADVAEALLPSLLGALPVERIEVNRSAVLTKSHIQGTTVMGDDPRDSVIDRHLRHHAVRNLFVLGSGCFPTASVANPTLTICALSLRAAAHA